MSVTDKSSEITHYSKTFLCKLYKLQEITNVTKDDMPLVLN